MRVNQIRAKKRRWIRIVVILLLLPLVGLGALLVIGVLNLFHAHEHCMKNAGLSLSLYAGDHDGKFPFHTNGFGDALLLLLEAPARDAPLFTAPGDDGTLLKTHLESDTDVPETRCTRSYVQGLCETNNPEIALLFDRYPTRGGDHFRRPWGPNVREVWLLGGGMNVIPESRWPEFKARQIKLLVAEGFNRDEAEAYYRPPERR
jgi:hypothetical protein